MSDREAMEPDAHGDDPGLPGADANLPVVEPIDPQTLGLELPADPEAAQQALLRELVLTRGEAQTYLDDLQRVAADFDNFRKRSQRDMAENIERASQRVLTGLLPTLDSLDLAAGYEPQSPSEEKLLEGMRGTYQQLLDAVAAEGLEIIRTVGETFDPAVHEAVSSEGNGDTELVVTEEVRRGYTLKGRVLRPALVVVGDEQAAKSPTDSEEPVEAD